jgi:hypothetical protein
MSTLFSVVGFCVQLIAIASLGAIIINSVCPSSTDSVLIGEDHPTGADDLLQSMIDTLSDDTDATLPIASSSCAKSMMPAVITTTISENVITDDYSALTIRQLKALCKDRHIKGYSSLRKHELVALLSAL